MPEGDTIFRAAAKLRGSIDRAVIRDAVTGTAALKPVGPAVAAIDAASLVGCRIDDIEARGKHLLMHLSDRRVIHSHMGMDGSWHVYAPGQPWRKPERQAEIVLRFDRTTAVCFSPKLLEILSAGELKHHRWLARLGPDLLATQFDEDDIVRRFRRCHRTPIGEALMNQTVVSGIGNVYKSELLFLDTIHPLTKVGELPEARLRSLMRRARKLLRRNVMAGPRRTRFRGDGHRHWVYGRQGEPCMKCGEAIRLTRQGELGRTTYYCPACQMANDQ